MNRKPAILVVDDEELLAEALAEILRAEKHEVVALSKPLAALKELESRRFSVVISDQRMPGLSGLELLGAAMRMQPNATRILITGVLNLDTVIEAINKEEIFRFVVKPWIREEFIATVANAVHRYELLEKNSRLEEDRRNLAAQFQTASTALEERNQLLAEQQKELRTLRDGLEQERRITSDFALKTLEAYHPGLAAQTRCVLQVCETLAQQYELAQQDRRDLMMSAVLFDIGWLRLPRRLIAGAKNAELDERDAVRVKEHPLFSQELAQIATGRSEVGQIVRAHHESYDGSGYPDGVRGSGSPWLARLLQPIVAYASFKEQPNLALRKVCASAGEAFDPEAVKIVSHAITAAGLPGTQRELTLAELTPGMVLSQEIVSESGVQLGESGQRISKLYLQQLRLHAASHSLPQVFAVYC